MFDRGNCFPSPGIAGKLPCQASSRYERWYRLSLGHNGVIMISHAPCACGPTEGPEHHFNERFTLLFPASRGPTGLDSLVGQSEARPGALIDSAELLERRRIVDAKAAGAHLPPATTEDDVIGILKLALLTGSLPLEAARRPSTTARTASTPAGYALRIEYGPRMS